jgi:hypothetical protein
MRQKSNVCVTIVTPRRNSQQFRDKVFLQVWQLPPRQIERCFTILLMLKKGLGREFRRISHGPAIRHHHPLRPGLQLGRHRPEPSRNVDRHCSVYALDDRLSLSLGFAGLIRCCVIDQLIADTPSVWSARAASG